MAINFPDSPSDGQTTTILGVTYTYDSDLVTWTANLPGSSGLDSASTIELIDSAYVAARVTSGSSTLTGLTDVTVTNADPAINSNPSSGKGHLWLN